MSQPLRLIEDAAPTDFHGMVGRHATMQALFDALTRAAPLEAPVVLVGETGTGKELAASAIHTLSGRAGRLVSVNMAGLPEHLAESELFGSVRGGYTGATDRHGLLERADRGTLHLDEAREISPGVQAKLLRVLENGLTRRVGAAQERGVRLRVVLSLQQHPRELLRRGTWREDFYHRVAGVVITLPPLRDRLSDLPVLAARLAAELGLPPVEPEEIRAWSRHRWPGNVRELRRVLERAAFLAGPERLASGHLAAAVAEAVEAGGTTMAERSGETVAEVLREHIVRVFEACERDAAAAAGRLGLSRSQVYRRLKQWRVLAEG